MDTIRHYASRLAQWSASPYVAVPALIGLLGYAWWEYTAQLKIYYAMYGMAPMEWVNELLEPENFTRNFPGGYVAFGKSAFMYIYPLAAKITGAEPSTILIWVVALELVLIASATYVFSRTLFPSASPMAHLLVVAVVIASDARSVNIGWFTGPFFKGVYYNACDAFKIFGIVAALKNRYALSGLLLGLAFATHPILGLHGAIFIAGMAVMDPEVRQQWRKPLWGALAFAAIAAIWTALMYEPQNITNAGLPDKTWFDIARLNKIHLFPITLGYFTALSREYISFLSAFILMAYYMGRRWESHRETDSKIIAGLILCLLMIYAGVALSETVVKPILVKVTLFRASELLLFVAIVYAVNGLWEDIVAGGYIRPFLAATALFSAFYIESVFPVLLTILIASPAVRGAFNRRVTNNAWIAALMLFTLLTIAGLAHLGYAGGKEAKEAIGVFDYWKQLAVYYLGGAGLLGKAFHIILPVWVAAVAARLIFKSDYFPVAVTAIALFGAHTYMEARQMDERKMKTGADYMAAQLWARDQTDKKALFYVDPAIFYPAHDHAGWRTYSERSSMGQLYEWVVMSGLYVSDKKLWDEGLARLDELGIDINEYFKMRTDKNRYKLLRQRAQESFYGKDDAWRMGMAQKHGIDYFVMENGKLQNPSRLPLAFQNDSVLVYSAK
ncbi:MAG: hypothetical protein HY751_01915 [Nitrospinae bacterium]|nr:hypothetical protein [Nitrospinota bacterium]